MFTLTIYLYLCTYIPIRHLVVSIIMLFNTRKALANIAAIKARHIPAKTLLEAFNKVTVYNILSTLII